MWIVEYRQKLKNNQRGANLLHMKLKSLNKRVIGFNSLTFVIIEKLFLVQNLEKTLIFQ